jgi:AcrR family transcriptional regulator
VAEQDRRVRRTRRALHEALIALVLERGYERLTVQDVLDRADVGRSTFYAHYRDKEALLTATFDDMREQLRREVDAPAPAGRPDPGRPAELIFEHAAANRRVYRALCGRQGGSAVQRHLHRMVREMVAESLHDYDPALPADVVAEFHAGATLSLLVWWIDRDFPHDPGWLAGAYRRLALPGPRAVPDGTPDPG